MTGSPAERRPGRSTVRRPTGPRSSAQPSRRTPSDRAGSTGRPPSPRPVVPELPPDVAVSDLPRDVLAELREFPPERRDLLARHLAAAGRLLDEDPEAAYQHAAYVRRSAARLASVREAAGVAGYLTSRYAEALADLRTYTRLSGDPRHLPLMADCERGLGRPERALALARSPAASRLGTAERIELRIVASGARRDLGEAQAALVELRGPELDSTRVAAWTPRLWYAYAEALLAAGDREAAARWFASAATVDSYGETDAETRLAELTDGANRGDDQGPDPDPNPGR